MCVLWTVNDTRSRRQLRTTGQLHVCRTARNAQRQLSPRCCMHRRKMVSFQQNLLSYLFITPFSALTLLVGRQERHPAGKMGGGKMVRCWRVICLERGADLHMAQLMPLPLTVSYFSKIHIGFTFLVSAHPGSPGQRAVKRVCVYLFFTPPPIGSTEHCD